MTVKHGTLKIEKGNEVVLIREIYDVYEKTDGNYKEHLINKTHHIEGYVSDGEEVIQMDVEETNYSVYPNMTLSEALAKADISNYTWTKELTTV